MMQLRFFHGKGWVILRFLLEWIWVYDLVFRRWYVYPWPVFHLDGQ